MRTIAEQIRDAFESAGISVADLLALSGLDLDRSSLQRKLTGDSPMKTSEAEALANALRISLVWPPKRTKAAS